MKKYIAAAILLSISSFSFNADATESFIYEVNQHHVKTTIAPKSGLLKANCTLFDKENKRIAGQLVTVDKDLFEQRLVIVEFNIDYDQHVAVKSVKCK